MVKSYYSSVEELKFIKQGFVVEIEKRINGEKATDDIKVVFINNIKAFINSTGITEKT